MSKSPSHVAGTAHPHQAEQAARPVGFYSARAAGNIDADNNPVLPPHSASATATRFNPHADSPSIRKTSGFDHTKSAPLRRDNLPLGAPSRDFVDPRTDPMRRLGVPGHQSPMGKGFNATSAYRPPTRRTGSDAAAAAGTLPSPHHPHHPHHPHGANGPTPATATANANPTANAAVKRPPLADLSNVPQPQAYAQAVAMQRQHSVTKTTDDGAEAKRQKLALGPAPAPAPAPGPARAP